MTQRSATPPDEGDETLAWLDDDLEAAYQRALGVIDALDASLAETPSETIPFPVRESQAQPSAEARPTDSTAQRPDQPLVTPRQILEAILFVGGAPVTTRRLCTVLRDEFTAEFIDGEIEQLNAQYALEERPYEIRLGEGGYRMELRPEFARVQSRTYGLAPKEVKLSREALEILALVAYRQPIGRRELAEAGQEHATPVLSQLLRRELIEIERRGEEGKEILYRTTPRFLRLFGLSRLDDLPRAGDLGFK